MKYMTKQSIFLFVILFLVASGMGWFLVRETNMVIDIADTSYLQDNQNFEKNIEFSQYNKVLNRQKITGVRDIVGPYKKVTISDGTTTFSFEVPDKWLTETRNAGEVTMNEEELREFLGTKWNGDIKKDSELVGNYWDFNWAILKSMSYDEMKQYYNKKRDEFSPGFPNATVSSGIKKAIWYTDMGWDQVNFYILDKKKDALYLSGVTYIDNLNDEYRKENEEILKKLPRDAKGKPDIDKGNPFGIVFSIEKGDKVLRISKEAYIEGEFEDGFKHLIETLTFE